MHTSHRLWTALALLAGLLSFAPDAGAQGCGPSNPNCIVTTMPPGDASNRAASDAFVQQAISPFSPPGGSNGQIQYNNNGDLGGFTASGDATINTGTGAVTIQPNAVTTGKIADSNVTTPKIADGNVTNAKLATGVANTVKGSLNGTTTSDLAIASCSAIYQFTQWVTGSGWQCGLIPVLPSRAVAATLNLSAFSAVKTLGYDQPGDGGGGTFVKRTANGYLDSRILTGSITAGGSGYVNNTYLYVALSGGSGSNAVASVTVSGGAVTSVTIRSTGGNSYVVGDVLTASNAFLGGSGSGFTWTVSAVSTPTCSFADIAPNKWQLVYNDGNFLNVLQCGAKVDYAGNDATATDDYTAIQNAYNFASLIHSPTIDGGGSYGAKVIHPPGNSLVCGGGTTPLMAAGGLSIEGHNAWASTLKMCAAWNNAQPFMYLCDPNTHVACFATRLHNITLYAPFAQDSAASVAMVMSNNIQQIDVFDRVAIYAGRRRCITLETGYGGAALLGMQNVECTPGSGTINTGIFINYGTTLVTMRNVHVETGGPLTLSGITITGGFVDLVGFHTEGISTGVEANITGSIANGFIRLAMLTGGASCTNLVLKQGGSVANSVYVSGLVQNGCTNSMNNGGAATTTFIGAWTLF